tara:strand:+ start:193 stop:555 length:363 start_codon:yes stop_codon:yes gene_type:complete
MTSTIYKVKSEVYLDKRNECYKKIIVIEPDPNDPTINNIIKKVSRNRLSEFEEFSPCCPRSNCFPAVMDPDNTNEFLSIDNIDKLFTILIANLYTIDYNLSKLLMKSQVEIPNLICFIRK